MFLFLKKAHLLIPPQTFESINKESLTKLKKKIRNNKMKSYAQKRWKYNIDLAK